MTSHKNLIGYCFSDVSSFYQSFCNINEKYQKKICYQQNIFILHFLFINALNSLNVNLELNEYAPIFPKKISWFIKKE